jgi:hypothetical protein
VRQTPQTPRIHYLVPPAVKRSARRGLDLRAQYGRGGTAIGIKTARALVRRDSLPIDLVVKISQYFPRHAGDDLQRATPPSNGHVAWLLWGGDHAWRWAEAVKRHYVNAHGVLPVAGQF